jgi:hypothetical protein
MKLETEPTLFCMLSMCRLLHLQGMVRRPCRRIDDAATLRARQHGAYSDDAAVPTTGCKPARGDLRELHALLPEGPWHAATPTAA